MFILCGIKQSNSIIMLFVRLNEVNQVQILQVHSEAWLWRELLL